MCTLIALHRTHPDAPLWVAANRDEYLDRPAAGPALRVAHGMPVVAPLDLRAGGTWWGLNRTSLFAGVTNRPTREPDPSRRSRGQLVLDALTEPDARAAAASLAQLPADAYNPFNLLLADGRDAFAVVYEGRARVITLDPGVHVIGNCDPNAPEVRKIQRTRRRAERLLDGPQERLLDGLASICRSHEDSGDRLGSTCVHTDLGYGTRSSTLLRIGRSGSLLRHTAGPPCTHEYEDFTSLLRELDQADEPQTGERAARKAS